MSLEYWYLFPVSIGVATLAMASGIGGADLFPTIVLKTIFAVGLMFIGLLLFLSWRQEQKEAMDELIKVQGEEGYRSELTDRAGNTYRYTVCNKALGRTFAAVGGAFLGMISWIFMAVGAFMLSTLLGA
jgi:hypothetical protein